MYIRAERLVLVAVRIAVLAFVLVSVGSLSSAGAATPVAQPGISVFKYPNNTWSASSLPRYATEVVTTSESDRGSQVVRARRRRC